jgi:upstream activation factor subunit UAF30
MDALILKRFTVIQKRRSKQEKDQFETEKANENNSVSDKEDDVQNGLDDSIESDSKLAARLYSEINRRDLRGSSNQITKKASLLRARKHQREKSGKNKNNKDQSSSAAANKAHPFQRQLKLSPQLAFMLGKETVSRPQAVSEIWKYIKDHSLQNPSDKREIFCDDMMRPIWGEKTTIFKLNKILSDHFVIDE